MRISLILTATVDEAPASRMRVAAPGHVGVWSVPAGGRGTRRMRGSAVHRVQRAIVPDRCAPTQSALPAAILRRHTGQARAGRLKIHIWWAEVGRAVGILRRHAGLTGRV